MNLTCYLRSESDYDTLVLKDCKTTTVGRSILTKIRCKSVSRNHLEIIPNCEKRIATVTQIGPNDSAVNGDVIGQGLYLVAKEGDLIKILADTDEFNYRLYFEEMQQGPVTNSDGSHSRASDVGASSKPVKTPKMFLPRSARSLEIMEELRRGVWESMDAGKVLVYATSGSSSRDLKSVVHAFDLDGTIITTKSGRVFPKDENDWKFLYDSSVVKLRKLCEKSNSKVIIISNQAGIQNGAVQIEVFKKKIENMMLQISIPLIVFVITGKNEYRKPLPTIWNCFIRSFNGGCAPDMSKSMYCGDAAGRKKDHSKVDRLFAWNVGLKFFTPEEFFLGQKPLAFTMPSFDPKQFLEQFSSAQPPSNNHIQFPCNQEVIIMVGYPASGKSSFVKKVLLSRGYVHVNRDTLKTAAKCKAIMENALGSGKSVAVDNTNPGKKDREDYLRLAKKHRIPCRCFIVKVDYEHALHNNRFRELTISDHDKVPEVAFNAFRAKFEEPSDAEGFTEVVQVNFIPSVESEDRKEMYSLYLLEK